MLLATLVAALPQAPAVERVPNAVIVSGVLEHGRLPLAALTLGDGGIGTAAVGTVDDGHLTTPGGVLVRAQSEGVKLDFPSGAELLLAPDGVVHLRGGEHFAAGAAVLELWLADGARVRAVRAARRGAAFDQVEVLCDGDATRLWLRNLAMRRAVHPVAPSGSCLLVLGRGDVLYRAAPIGPMVALERVLCAERDRDAYPPVRLVIAADVLVGGLQELPAHVPPHSVQFPQAPEAARSLAALAPELFPAGVIARPLGAAGDLVLPLAGGFRLGIEQRHADSVWLALYRDDVTVPAVEWSAGVRTTLHLLRPDGGEGGGPRYYLRGIEATVRARDLLPVPAGADPDRMARRILRALGARPRAAAVPVAAQAR